MTARRIEFRQRRGPPVAPLDPFESKEVEKTRRFLVDLRAELTAVAKGKPSVETPNFSLFMSSLTRCVNFVMLTTATAIKNTAENFARERTSLAHSAVDTRMGIENIVLAPLDAKDSLRANYVKFAAFMAHGTKRTRQEIEKFIGPDLPLTTLIALDNWLEYTRKVIEKDPPPAPLPTAPGEWAKTLSKWRPTLRITELSTFVGSRAGVIDSLDAQSGMRQTTSPLHRHTVVMGAISVEGIDAVKALATRLFDQGSGDKYDVYENIAATLAFMRSDESKNSRKAIERMIDGLGDAEKDALTARFTSLSKRRGKTPAELILQYATDTTLKSDLYGAVSYLQDASSDDADGRMDVSRTHDIMQLDTVRAFIETLRMYRGKKNGMRRLTAHPAKKAKPISGTGEKDEGDGGGNDDDARDNDDVPDSLDVLLRTGLRLLILLERVYDMRGDSANSKPSNNADVAPIAGDAPYRHAYDADYFKLGLGQPDTRKKPAVLDLAGNVTLRRRWWWAYMLSTLVTVDIDGRAGPAATSDAALLEVSEFLANPTAFARSSRRHWIIVGPPGTGKTTFARLLAVMYHLLGLFPLGSVDDGEVTMRKASDLIAGFEGQTRLRTVDILIGHIGMALPVDEAYALVPAREGASSDYGQEAVDQLVASLQDYGSLIGVMLIGYSSRIIDRLLRSNEGMPRRFPRTLNIPEYSAADLVAVMRHLLEAPGADYANVDWSEVEAFFGLVTGAVNTFAFTDSATRTPFVLTRDTYVSAQRPDETVADFATRRKEAIRNKGDYGNYFEAENASGIVDIVADIKRRRIAPSALTTYDIVRLTSTLLMRHNIIQQFEHDGDSGKRPRNSDTEKASDEASSSSV